MGHSDSRKRSRGGCGGAEPQASDILPSLSAWLTATLPRRSLNAPTTPAGPQAGIAEPDPNVLVRQAVLVFQRRNHRLPAAGSRRNITQMIEHLHLSVAVHCTDVPWWTHDVWTYAPTRGFRSGRMSRHTTRSCGWRYRPAWLREGLRFWLRSALTYELLAWSSVADRCGASASSWAVHTHPWPRKRSANRHPTWPAAGAFMDYLEYLRPRTRRPARIICWSAAWPTCKPKPKLSTRSCTTTLPTPRRPPAIRGGATSPRPIPRCGHRSTYFSTAVASAP